MIIRNWRPMSEAPKHGYDDKFLASRAGQVILCWWNDDRHAIRPKPYWDGTDGHHNVDFCRKNTPDGWMPVDEARRHAMTDTLPADLRRHAKLRSLSLPVAETMLRAADEIEQLRAERPAPGVAEGVNSQPTDAPRTPKPVYTAEKDELLDMIGRWFVTRTPIREEENNRQDMFDAAFPSQSSPWPPEGGTDA